MKQPDLSSWNNSLTRMYTIIKTKKQDQTQSSKQHFMLETTNNIITATERREAEFIWKWGFGVDDILLF